MADLEHLVRRIVDARFPDRQDDSFELAEVASLMKVHVKTIRRRIATGRIRTFGLGETRLVAYDDLIAALLADPKAKEVE